MTAYNNWSSGAGRPLSRLQTFFLKLAGIVVAINVCVVFSISYVEKKIERAGEHTTIIFANLVRKVAAMEDLPEAQKNEVIADLRKIAARNRPYVDALLSP